MVILSDFRELGGRAEKHLANLARHNDIIAALLYDPLESEPPPAGRYRLGSAASYLTLDTGQTVVAEHWAVQFRNHRDAVHDLCRRQAIHFMQAATSDRPLRTLQYGLARHVRQV